MRKLKKILAFAMAVMAIVCVFSVNAFAADHGTENFYFTRDSSGTEYLGQLQLYNDAIIKDSNNNWISTKLYAYGARGVRVADNGNYETYVRCEYVYSGGYGKTAIVADTTQGTSYARAELTIDYTSFDPINGQGYLRIYNHIEQICRHFNDDNTSDYCTHYYAALGYDEMAYCQFDDEISTWEEFD